MHDLARLGPIPAASAVIGHLSALVAQRMDRTALFSTLSRQLQLRFHFDRLQINLYDAEREFLNAFTRADGTIVEILSSTRIAHNAVAWQAIQTRRPLIIEDLASPQWGGGASTLASAGLNATIVVPLILNREVLGTLHVSFVRRPENPDEILDFLAAVAPVLASFLFVVLTEEQREKERAMQRAKQATPLREDPGLPEVEDSILDTRDMAEVMSLARKAAKLHIPVLILGETGTGKSMLAKWIHRNGPRRNASFVRVNCPSLVPTLFESEMFGYAKGAFTGAYAKRAGRVELAQDGTLFLDEIGELQPEIQSKILHVLEENSFERVGEAKSVAMDVRILSATNVDVNRAMDEGLLRKDLFFRLATVVLCMPPLRQRRGDIPALVRHFVGRLSRQWDLQPPKISRGVMKELCAHSWPGNIRELRNAVSELLILSLDRPLTEAAVQDVFGKLGNIGVARAPAGPGQQAPAGAPPVASFEDNERGNILNALRATGGRISGPRGAAALLGLPRSTLQHRMKKLGIQAR